jgi:hypothetical protein
MEKAEGYKIIIGLLSIIAIILIPIDNYVLPIFIFSKASILAIAIVLAVLEPRYVNCLEDIFRRINQVLSGIVILIIFTAYVFPAIEKITSHWLIADISLLLGMLYIVMIAYCLD